MSRRLIIETGCLLLLASVSEGLGCRYNVRETGFVDLNERPYVLVCYTDESTPEAFERGFLRAADEALAQSTVTYELVETDLQNDHPALEYLEGREEVRFPYVQIISPQGTTIPAGLISEGGMGIPEPEMIGRVVQTPVRDRITSLLAKCYGVVLLVEGVDAAENREARRVAKEAITQLESLLDLMPKPVRRGPVLQTLDASRFHEERVLLWALGLEPVQSVSPSVVVIYGKGRWLGPKLTGQEIQIDRLLGLLSVIGADCECGLDPGILRGKALPIVWGPELQSLVAGELGFDPENPLVKIEVGQIMRLRTSLYPERLPRREVSVRSADELPVPFVEDDSGYAIDSPVTRSVIWLVGGLSGLVVCIGFWLAFKRGVRSR